jgi:hypothetical protein
LTTYNIKQEYFESFDFIGNGYGCETRKVNVTLSNVEVCVFYYNEDFSLIIADQQEYKIIRNYKLFGFSEIEIINQKTDEVLGKFKLPKWHNNDFKELGRLIYIGKEYSSRRLRIQKDRKTVGKEVWDYVVELSGSNTKIIYSLFQEVKPLFSANHRKQPYHGEIQLENGDLAILILGIYLVQILLNNEDVVNI